MSWTEAGTSVLVTSRGQYLPLHMLSRSVSGLVTTFRAPVTSVPHVSRKISFGEAQKEETV